MKKIFAVLATMLLVTSLFVGNAAAEKVLKVGISKEPANLNPVLIHGVYGESIAGNIFDTLVSFKESAKEAAPLLAKSWTISADGKVYTFKLRNDVKFHNGDAFTSADVKYTLDEIMNEKNASPSAQFFKPIQKIETPDAQTIVITLDAPYAPFLLALGSQTCGILPSRAAAAVGMEKFSRSPIGTGPFKFVEWAPDDKIVLEKNKDYFIAEPKLDKVVFRPIPKPETMAAELLSGGLDLGGELLPQDIDRMKKEGLVVKSVPGLTSRYLGFNAKRKPFSDLRFRKAVYHAVPFDQAIPGIFREAGDRAYSWIPVGVLGDDVDYMKSRTLPFDMAKAKALFDELKKDGVMPEKFEFTIYSPQDPQRKKIATVVSTQLRQFGITVKVETPEWATLFPMLKQGQCDMYAMGWGSVPDPDRWTYKIFIPDSNMNFSQYDEPIVTEALKQGRSASDPVKRSEYYKTAMRKALVEDFIHIPVAFLNTTNVMSKKVVGFEPSPEKYVHLVTAKRNVDLK
ncbi:peptide/nickel transport system substrate-binding protein [Malonomonas rubra DSM 5091]|uniref:Peptide/nickel transport system substrate-binding protein n=1 Tax=Malonomonas rubra DSM 5091 TaxID=1122189 RepID=A0A1M6FF52_MALRU|nr:ABC transporter substrate-binding protein [Malonomonas rubra]SHI96287.1 peptide/nickel transport system substrate-binding protein [Malonomonas rubra DSM 5091]